jgi:predicted enzyme related to lactoylglutathione lyase
MNHADLAVRLEAVLIETSRPEELADFYRRGFNLDPPKVFGENHLGFSIAGFYLGFDRVSPDAISVGSSISIWFRVPAMQPVFDRLVQMGAEIKSPPDEESSPGETLASLYDPDGNVIGLIAPG